MPTEHVGVVTGLPDLLNFLAALRRRTGALQPASMKVSAVLFGAAGSLPATLVAEFNLVLRLAFPNLTPLNVPTACVRGNRFDQSALAGIDLHRSPGECRIVYGNAIHKRFHQEFYAHLQPDEFVFFDNGLSSYADHGADIEREFARLAIPFPSLACYSLSPPLDVPPYLAQIPGVSLNLEDYQEAFAALRHSELRGSGPWRAQRHYRHKSLSRE